MVANRIWVLGFCFYLGFGIYYFRRKHYFGPYIFGSQLIWSLYFDSSQFSPYYFQLAVNLIPMINLLMKNAYLANSVHIWHI